MSMIFIEHYSVCKIIVFNGAQMIKAKTIQKWTFMPGSTVHIPNDTKGNTVRTLSIVVSPQSHLRKAGRKFHRMFTTFSVVSLLDGWQQLVLLHAFCFLQQIQDGQSKF